MPPEAYSFFAKRIRPGGGGCWTWIGARRENGYGQAIIGGHRGKLIKAHRLAWQLFNGPIPDGLHVLHNCDNRICVNPIHLRIGTQKDNNRDALIRGRKGRTTLKPAQVLEIRQLLSSGATSQADIARKYGVRHYVINKIKLGKTWELVQ